MSPRPSPHGDPPQPQTRLTSPITSAFAGGSSANADAFFNVTSFSSSDAVAGPSWSAPRRADRVGKGAKGGPENALHGFRGVRQRSWGKWVAEIRAPRSKKRIWLGSFADARTAALTYDRAARKLYGARAQLNFLEGSAAFAPANNHPDGASFPAADARSGLISSGSGSGGSASDSEGGASAGVIADGGGGGERTSRSVETPALVRRCASSDDATPPSLARLALTGGAPLLTRRDSDPEESGVGSVMAAGSRPAALNPGTLAAAARCDYIGALPLPSMTFKEIFNRSCPPLTAPAAASTSVSALGARAPSAEKRGMWQGPVESFRAPASSAGRVDPSAESTELAHGAQQTEGTRAGWSHGGSVAGSSVLNRNPNLQNQLCESSQGFFAVAGNEGLNLGFPACPAVLPAQLSQQPALTVRGGLVPYGSIFARPPVMSVGGTEASGMAAPWGCGAAVPWMHEGTMEQQGAMVRALRESRAQLVREQMGSSGGAVTAGNAWPAGTAEIAGAGMPARTVEQQGAMVRALRESRAQLVREQMGGSDSAGAAGNAWSTGAAGSACAEAWSGKESRARLVREQMGTSVGAVTAGNTWTAGSAGAGVWGGRGMDGADAVQGGGAGMEHGMEHGMEQGMEHGGVLDAAAIERMLQLSEALLGPADPPTHGPHAAPHPEGSDDRRARVDTPHGPVIPHASYAAAFEDASALLACSDYQRLNSGLPDAVSRSVPDSLPGFVPHASAAAAAAAAVACKPVCELADLVPTVSPSPMCMGGEFALPGSNYLLPPAVGVAPCAVNTLTIDAAHGQPCFDELLSPMPRLW
ncbi:unnamed protein product [Closterium sp. Yama58-4]|nr:unnamed protein product [Closterium sp. Yama58-4]